MISFTCSGGLLLCAGGKRGRLIIVSIQSCCTKSSCSPSFSHVYILPLVFLIPGIFSTIV